MKKTRLSFSSISKDTDTSQGASLTHVSRMPLDKNEPRQSDKKRSTKSSTYQYRKKQFGPARKSVPFNSKSQSNANGKIPPIESGVVRVIPLGGVEEVGKNMTAIEIGDDIIVIDAGMHFSTEATPGVDYVIPNTTYLEERKEKIRALIITHGHLDHILAAGELKISFNIPIYGNKKDTFLITKMPQQARKYLKTTALPIKIDFNVGEVDKIKLGDETLEVVETPGHPPGSISLYCKNSKIAFVGDLIFKDGSVGRSDFGYSNKLKLKRSIAGILKLPKETTIYPGHGEEFPLKELTFNIQFI